MLQFPSFPGKGVSIWDTFSHDGSNIANGETPDIACDSYHKYKEDIQLMKQLNVSRNSRKWGTSITVMSESMSNWQISETF